MCEIIDAAAEHASRSGFVSVRDDIKGDLRFIQGEVRTVFTDQDIPTLDYLPLVYPTLLPRRAALSRHGNVVEVTILRGGPHRDSDLVEYFIDVFEGQ